MERLNFPIEDLKCKQCNNLFDLENRVPIIKYPCTHNICKQCYLLQDPQNQQPLCNICQETCQYDPLNFKVNQALLNFIKHYQQSTQQAKKFVCSEHQNQKIKFYCSRDYKFLCSTCVLEHADHMQEARLFNQEQITNDLRELIHLLEGKRQSMDSAINILQALLNKQSQIQIKEILLGFNQSMKKIQEAQIDLDQIQNQFKIFQDKQIQRQNAPNPEVRPQQQMMPIQAQVQQQINERYLDSTIMKVEDLQTLDNFFGKQVKISLLYRGSRDGFHYDYWKPKVIGKTNIMHVIKSEYQSIFGSFNSVPFDFTSHKTNQEDKGAFIFQLNDKVRLEQRNYIYTSFANRQGRKFIFMIGRGDIAISNDCNQNKESNCNLGVTFNPPKKYTCLSKQARSYLAGSFEYRVVEIEAFEVINL